MLFVIPHVHAQVWMKDIQNENPNFYEIQKAFNDYWKDRPVEKGKGYKQFKRWEWYWQQRVGPNGEFPKNTVLHDELAKYNELHSNEKSSAISSATVANWSFKGPQSSSGGYSGIGRINCIAFHPSIATTFWVGTPAGGLWKTTNGGSTWTTNTDNLPVLGVSDIAIDPTNPNIMYIATGDGDAAVSLSNGYGDTKSIGVLKSTNGGASWSAVLTASVSQNILIRRLLINPSNPNILLAATSVGIYRTTNAGVSWALVSSNIWFIDMEFKPTDPNYVYAATYSPNGNSQIFSSSNNGQTWSQVTNFTGYTRINLAVTANFPALVDAVCVNSTSGLGGLWYSANSGASFTQYYFANCTNNLLHNSFNGSGCDGQGTYDLAYAINPANFDEIWLGGVNTWRTTNGGSTWFLNNVWSVSQSSLVPNVHADKHDIAFHPLNNNFIYECNDGGIYVTNNSGSSWTDLSNSLGISQIYRIGTSATNTDKVICGLQDNGTKEVQTNSWYDRTGGDGMECIIDYTNSNVQYSSYVNGEIYKTTNNWSSSTTIVQNNGVGVNAPGDWVTPYLMHPTNNNILIIGKAQVFQTTNGGTTWSQLGTLPGSTGDIISMAYAPSNPAVIYVATATQVYKTTNSGTTWSIIGTSATRITYLAVDATNPQRLWVTKSGYTAADKVWYTGDGGTSWSNFSGTLPNIPVNCIVYQKNNSDGLYIGTDVGVYFWNSTLPDWIPFNTGLPNVIVNELEISYNNNKLWAATFGRGLWNSDLYCPTIQQISPISGPNSLCSGTSNSAYSITAVPGATLYTWTLPAGWSGSGNSNVIYTTPMNSGNISVSASNSCGISPTQNINVNVFPLPNISVTTSHPFLCSGEAASLNATGANTYTWSTGTTGSNLIVAPLVTTVYIVTGTDANNCSNMFTITQNVDECLSINEAPTEVLDYISVSPNPFGNSFSITNNSPYIIEYDIRIFNALGALVHSSHIQEKSVSIDLSTNSSGIYFIQVSGQSSSKIIKLIKE
ncbi:MAG: T9SS type A sorting domain-containing protein [Bacteroidia bacterium]|nr:T9SS type A sorting domain-containing protein [Bacteroidia bacterium]